MPETQDFERLIVEAEAQPLTGWDFSWIKKRVKNQPLPWNYPGLVHKRASRSPNMLDLGTGGGEVLAKLSCRPQFTVATEAYVPNVSVAARRLHPVNVQVIQVGGAPDNNQQTSFERTPLPFRGSSFHLIINRHEAYVAKEVSRILRPQGHFVTQQVGSQEYNDFHELLGVPLPTDPAPPWDLELAKTQLEEAGLQIVDSGTGLEIKSFLDVGAFAWYLKSVPWVVEGFSISKYKGQLRALNGKIEKEGCLRVRLSRFWLDAVKANPAQSPSTTSQ